MTEKNKYRIINIRRYIGNENPELGEDELRQILSEFSCPMNPDVERFLKHSSIEFKYQIRTSRMSWYSF